MPSLFDLPFEDPGDAGDEPVRPPAAEPPVRRVYTVSDLAAAVRGRLEETFFEVWLEGEISNCRRWTSTGHLYFTLKDDQAQLKAVMFRSALRYLRFEPADGQHVLARGRVTVYEPRGECQVVCEHLEPRGLGALQLAFEQLKRKLAAEGLFDEARKRPLPLLPRTVGVVTSLDGAAIQDVIKVVSARHAGLRLLVRPCRVQGEGAAHEIARALRQLARHPGVDVVIVARGGGSLEDLWAFNDEVVARAIAAAPVPVVSGVGHETDVTIADFVADLRAATPSNAAELVVARRDDLIRRLRHAGVRMTGALRHALGRRRAAVHGLASRRGLVTLQTRVANRARHLAELTWRIRHALHARLAASSRILAGLDRRLEAADQRRRLGGLRTRLVAADAALQRGGRASAHRAEVRLGSLAARLGNLSPLAVLGRGYAVCFAADEVTVVRDATRVRPGESVHVRVERGSLDCTVVKAGD